ncbi:short chain dehydrogenase citE [Apiospora phragmitis]|uniref:Short chain dehydrogenase citE n=1 Tax=Apiospora phragmitis TaxID=2905665 RepID=A0ABR1TPN5_9PEZI
MGRRGDMLTVAAAELKAQQQQHQEKKKPDNSNAAAAAAQILTFAVDVTDEAGMDRVFVEIEETFGANHSPDVVINCAGWNAFEINLSTAGALFPANGALPMSAYAASKLEAIKVMEYVGAETDPGVLRVLSVHPGVVPETEGGRAMAKESGIVWEGDDINQPAHFLVWAASKEAEFLRNKLVFAAWDVDELVARKEEIAHSPELLIGLNGFPRAI